MTGAQRHSAIIGLIDRYTAEHTTSKKVARRTLIDEGIYTENGKLRAEFGGRGKKVKDGA